MNNTENHFQNRGKVKGSILVVDDNPDSLRLLTGMLTKEGYKVRPTSSGALAITSALSILPDLILLDIKMPDLDGYEVCRRLKSDARVCHVPVLFISGLTEVVDKIKGFRVGAVDYITKPFQHEEVLARVKTHVSLARMHQQLEQMVKERTLELTEANEQLKNEIIDRKLAEGREKHLNQVLRAVRNVNQLIVQEKNRGRLLQKACEILLETRFYSYSWIILTDARGKPTASAQSGLGDCFFELVRDTEQGTVPYCVRKAGEQPDVLIIENRELSCRDCPIAETCHDRGMAIVRLDHNGKIFGFLAISYHNKLVFDKEETALIQELAGDVTFALSSYEQDEKRARAETALLESEQKYRELVDSLPQIVFEMDEKGNLIFANRNAFDIFGYTDRDLNDGLNAFDMLVSEDHGRALENLEQEYSGDSPGGAEYTAKRKDGSTFPVILHAAPVQRNNKPAGLRGIVIDLTEQKKMEADLTRRSMAMDQATDTIVITDPEGIIIYVNPSFEKSTGYTRQEVLGKNPRVLKSGKQNRVFYRDLWQTISDGKTWSGRFINRKKDGTFYPEDATISPVFSPAGEIVNYVAIKRDITDRVSLESQLCQAQKMEAIGTLAGGIAHDFNNILGIIMGRAQLSQLDISESNPAYRNIVEVIEAGQRAKDLVKQILAFSRHSEYERKLIKPGNTIREALRMLRSSLPSTIEIQQNITAESSVILADPIQIQQIVMNLSTNAFHAMEETGGMLTVSLAEKKCETSGMRMDAELAPGRYLQLTVSDTGKGMESHVMKRIFDPYYTTKKPGEGTGLGLSVVHGIVESHGGSISVKSEVGKGTTFQIFLPRVEHTKKVVEIEKTGPIPTGNERILFVDDDEFLADTGREVLGRLGYQVVSETNSIDALKLFNAQPEQFDLVITDYTMPKMTGMDLAKNLMLIRPDIPVILCTGFNKLVDREKTRKIGIKAFMMKPIVIRDIAEVIRKVLDTAIEK